MLLQTAGNTKWSKAGYFEYQFLDQEANVLPYKVGSYLGTKSVQYCWFYTAPDATKSSVNNTIKTKYQSFAADVFLDLPVGKKENKMAVTAYSVFYDYDFGPNYLRNVAIMNIGSVDPNFTGSSIGRPWKCTTTIGSGNIWYTQAGILLPSKQTNQKFAYNLLDFL
jgi:hypothetical protein